MGTLNLERMPVKATRKTRIHGAAKSHKGHKS